MGKGVIPFPFFYYIRVKKEEYNNMSKTQQKFLDQEGLKYLWSQISMQDYPNN
jgi:hypothetical protein